MKRRLNASEDVLHTSRNTSSIDSLPLAQVAHSLIADNTATFGGGSFLAASRAVSRNPDCVALSTGVDLLQPVRYTESIFSGNQCARGGFGAGAAVFSSSSYLMDVLCGDEGPRSAELATDSVRG